MSSPITDPGCPLCREDGGLLIHRDARWRVVRVTDTPAHPVFYRVIWQQHVAEFSDLDAPQRAECMDAVTAVERVLRLHAGGIKINLAALGNVVPHLHWHVIARYPDDAHYPAPVWASAQRDGQASAARAASRLTLLDAAVATALDGSGGSGGRVSPQGQ